MSQLASRKNLTWSSVSTPSVTTVIPNVFDIEIIEEMMSLTFCEKFEARKNPMSIFSVFISTFFSVLSEESLQERQLHLQAMLAVVCFLAVEKHAVGVDELLCRLHVYPHLS